MIHNQSRAYYIGASDMNTLFMRHDTEPFRRFWAVKLGYASGGYVSREMLAGTHWEHRILDYLGIKRRDRQIIINKLRLRVNLDGEDGEYIYEVKTHRADKPFRVSTAYMRQAQCEMFAAKKRLKIVSYGLLPEDYDNYYGEVDPARLAVREIPFDKDLFYGEMLPKIEEAARCLKKRRWIDES